MSTHLTHRTDTLATRTLAAPAAAVARARSALHRRFHAMTGPDAGMSTVEYAVGTIAAAAFGAVLYTVVSGDSIPDALGGIIEQALNTSV
ncbi:DUF4244 domain-containing protein [Dietzia lutea]|uniref:DUF4244 domain-containing protein n=1 Tax=Dietzia lutea TaxID=546160 RepID=A0A2S1R4R3_9ACTN|nr:hypothetical protein A6035_02760 [Dietzia lutea]